MVVIGGLDPTVGDVDPWTWNSPPDPWPQGIGVFDLTALQWKDSYEAKAPHYSAPDIVTQYYQSGYGYLHNIVCYSLTWFPLLDHAILRRGQVLTWRRSS